MERTIKDPTFNIYKDGGNVETKGKELKKEELLKLAKDEADLKFDFESGISDQILRDYYKDRKPGQSITDWLDSKPREYFLNIPLQLRDGGKVISLSSYLKQKEKPKIKKIDLDSIAPGKAIVDLSDAEREVVNKLLRMSFNIKGD
jgi:hypothetical protein|tara:strand:+ start:1174 stop:1611 length:438 start_codon:yes stop_codon:yes gene_type:complete